MHYGTTTQDVIDTATMLQAREALDLLDTGLGAIAGLMAGLVDEHRDQPQMGGRSSSMPGRPPSG